MSHPLYLTRKTTRAALSQDDDSENPGCQSEREFEHEVSQSPVQRRKTEDISLLGGDEGSIIEPFRLVSWSLPAHPISLLPAYHPNFHLQRPLEDTADEACLRKTRAEHCAIDADYILTYGAIWSERRSDPTLTLIPSGADLSHFPSLLVVQRTLSTPTLVTARERRTPDYIKCCPLVPVTDQNRSDKPRRRRKRKFAPRDHPSPSFFRPMPEWGGKSAGYAMGWSNSRRRGILTHPD